MNRYPSRFRKESVKTLESVMNEYLLYKRSSNKPKTLKNKERLIRSPLVPILDRPPKYVEPHQIAIAIQDWADKRKPSTARIAIQECKAFWTWMAEEDYVKSQLWEHKLLKRLPKRYPKRGRVLPQHKGDDARKLYEFLLPLAKAKPRGKATVALLGLTMGFRVGEILTMAAGRVDNGGACLWVDDAKTEAGQRPVEVPTPLVEVVQAAAHGLPHTARLWPFTHSQIYPSVRKFCLKAGVRRETGMHALRRTNTTLRVLGGQDPDTVIKAIGHTKFSMTTGHYIEPGTIERLGQERVNRLLNSNDLDSPNSATT